MIISGITPTEERSFTQPYLENDPLVIVTLDDNLPIRGLRNLNGKKTIVNTGFTSEKYMSKINGPILKKN